MARPEAAPQMAPEERETAMTLACPNPECRQPVYDDERYCGSCGHDLKPDAPGAAQPDVRPDGSAAGSGPPRPQEPEPAAPAAVLETTPAEAPTGPRPCAHCGATDIADGYCSICGHAQPRPRDRMEEENDRAAAVTDRGYRHHRNEDAFALGGTQLPDGTPVALAVVCDGVSSASRPDEASEAASRAAVNHLHDALAEGEQPQRAMYDAVLGAADAVRLIERPPGSRNAPACTFVAGAVYGGEVVVGWVGDSRAYWVPDDRDAEPELLTEDDSWAVGMVKQGLMSKAEAMADHRAHAITGWLGADNEYLQPHTAAYRPDRNGVLLICTDGLWNYAEEAVELAGEVPPHARLNPRSAARRLVGFALEAGGHDNITVAVMPLAAAEERASAQASSADASSAEAAVTPTVPEPAAAPAPVPAAAPAPAPPAAPDAGRSDPEAWTLQQPDPRQET